MLLQIDKSYQSKISQMERPVVNILSNGEVKVKHQIWAVFSFVLQNVEKKQILDNSSNSFGQLVK